MVPEGSVWPSDFWGRLLLAMEGSFALVFLVGVFASAWSWYCDRNDWLSISPNDISWSDDETGTRSFRSMGLNLILAMRRLS